MKFKLLIKNKFISTIIGSFLVIFGNGLILSLNYLIVYIISYIHLKDPSVTIQYSLFIYLVFTFASSFSKSLGGYLENQIGFFKTIIVGFIIVFLANIGFIFQQNIWLCYFLSIMSGIGFGISTSLLIKNIVFYYPNKKGFFYSLMGSVILGITYIFDLVGETFFILEEEPLKKKMKYIIQIIL